LNISDEKFDLDVRRELKYELDDYILHVWANCGLKSMQYTREEMKLPCILERASTHIEHQKSVLDREYALAALNSPISEETVGRMNAEYELAYIILVPSAYAALTFPKNLHEKIRKVPFGVDTEIFKPGPVEHDGFRVAFVGANSVRKGFRYIDKALRSPQLSPPVDCWMAGNCSFMFGHMAYASMPDLYNRCDVFVLPSLEEGNSLAVNEALACGLPVIVTKECGLWPDWVSGKHGTLIASKDSKAIADAIQYYRDNPQEAERHGRAGRKLAEKHTWQVYGRDLCRVYEQLAGGHGQ